MEEFLAETEQYLGHTIKIYQDCDPESPREWDNLGTMVCFHKRYTLGDEGHGFSKDSFESWSELEGHLQKECDAAVMLPLYLYDHSGITINTKGFSCPWDSGRVGVIFVDRDKLRKEYGIKRISKSVLDRATKVLQGEVETYDRYLTGQVYGFRIEDADGEDVDSCWGYYDEPSEIIKECKASIDHIIKAESEEANKHYPKIEVFVTKGGKFRASIRESITEPTYEVTVGGEEWQKGKGRNHEQDIVAKMDSIIATLNSEFVVQSASVMIKELETIGKITEVKIEGENNDIA